MQNLGTIQGSKNGPRFFDIYSNDMNYVLNDDQGVLYADDTALVYVGDSNQLVLHVNEKLALLLDWCNYNNMVINPSKSQYILITNKKVDDNPIVKLGGDNIERVSNCKYLGMYIDENIKYHHQISHIESKLRQLRGMTFRIRNYIDKAGARKIYYAMVYSVITYCIAVWGGVLYYTARGNE